MTLKKHKKTQNTLSKNCCTNCNLNFWFLKAFLHKFLVTLCARRRNSSRSTWCWLLIADLIGTYNQKIYPISLQRSLFTLYAGEWFGTFVNELTRFTHSTPFKICFSVQTLQIGILKGEKRKNGEKSENNRIFKTKKSQNNKKVSFCSKKCTLMRGYTNERFS